MNIKFNILHPFHMTEPTIKSARFMQIMGKVQEWLFFRVSAQEKNTMVETKHPTSADNTMLTKSWENMHIDNEIYLNGSNMRIIMTYLHAISWLNYHVRHVNIVRPGSPTLMASSQALKYILGSVYPCFSIYIYITDTWVLRYKFPLQYTAVHWDTEVLPMSTLFFLLLLNVSSFSVCRRTWHHQLWFLQWKLISLTVILAVIYEQAYFETVVRLT